MLGMRDIAHSKVVETVRTVEQLGKDQYQQFVTKRVQERTTPLFDTIQKKQVATIQQSSRYKREV